jgi:4-amino-4-deoxy-L-arabinose transferase-like glycosyltransferase
MRIPSILAGTALVPVVYLLGDELYDRRAGLAGAALCVVAPFAVWYSDEARMYALFMLFAALALLGQLRALRTGERRDWALFAVGSIGMLWTQYFGVLFAGVQQAGFLYAAVSRRGAGAPVRPLLTGWLLSTGVIVLACAPLMPFALDQFQANQSAGRGFGAPSQAGSGVDGGRRQPGVYVGLTNAVWAVWGYHSATTMASITALWPLAMLLALLLLGRGRSPRTALTAACAVIPALALFAIGELKPFLFEIRYFSGAVPLLLVLLARAATSWTRGRVLTALVLAALMASLGVAAADQQVNRSNPRLYDFEGTLARLRAEQRPGDVVLYEPYYLRDIVRYYAPHLRSAPLRDGLPARRYAKRVIVMGSFLDNPASATAVKSAVRKLERTRQLESRWHRPQIRVWELK